MTIPRILSIAGSDPSGGAGIQADIKSISANGGYGMAVLAALTVQNTRGVSDVHIVPAEFVSAQLAALSEDIEIDAVKIGMLASAEVIDAVGEWLDVSAPPIVILDPVMISTSGDRLLDPDAERALLALLPRASVITPNLDELAALHGSALATTIDEATVQAQELARRIGVPVLAKGGHLDGDTVIDSLVSPDGSVATFAGPRIDTANTHGTGCSLSSAIATWAARTKNIETSVERATSWLSGSLAASDQLDVGSGHGPVHHFAALWDTAPDDAVSSPDDIREGWWEKIVDVRSDIDALPFICQLAEGTLAQDDFMTYIAQDAIYLGEYSRVLAIAAALAPTPEERAFWASGTQGAIQGELELHQERWGERPLPPASKTTRGYIDHLLASSRRGYAELIAAVLPCYWLYTDLGHRLRDGSFGPEPLDPAHPYASWLATYDDPVFAAANARAIEFVTRTAAAADADTRARMWDAFRIASVWEREFFDQTAASERAADGGTIET